MKLLTINTHSLIEENYSEKLKYFVNAISEEKPDIIALQEVNQSVSEKAVTETLKGYVPCGKDITIREDNHVYRAVKMLSDEGVEYYWTWLPLKNGYAKFDEGIAVMSRSPITDTKVITVSSIDDYTNWKTRKLIGICTQNNPDEWFFSVHYGWWDDDEEPFQKQWERTCEQVNMQNVWLMGDFNTPSDLSDEGYSMAENSGWYDSYILAENKDDGITVGKVIDGWKEKINSTNGMRIDYIWSRKKSHVKSSHVIFNGINYPVISDHYGVIINV